MKKHLPSRDPSLDKTYLIISISANALVASATRAGFRVISIDCFNDVDTAKNTLYSFQLANLSDRSSLDTVFQEIDLQNITGVVIGSGFEPQPELLSDIQQRLPLLANSAEVMQRCCDPQSLFSMFEQYEIAYPETRFIQPIVQSSDWLIKQGSGTGGSHIRYFSATTAVHADDYFQRFIEGESYSVNFLANQTDFSVIGINRIWCSLADDSLFSYGGAVSNVQIPKQAISELERIVSVITVELGLRGLCGIDFILTDDQQVLVLDVNPRPTATLELYDDPNGSLFSAHIAVFEHNSLPSSPLTMSSSNAHQLMYATDDLVIPDAFDWPEWTVCRPRNNSRISKGEPICLIHATDILDDEVTSRLQQRYQTLMSGIELFSP